MINILDRLTAAGAERPIAFSELPSEGARERLKQELIKDVAMVEGS